MPITRGRAITRAKETSTMSTLRNIREKKGFSLPQLAARAGISARTLTDYEEGRQSIALPHAKLLAKALWVGIEELIPPAGSAPPQTPGHNPAQSANGTQQAVITTQPARPHSSTAQPALPLPETQASSADAQPAVVVKRPEAISDPRGRRPSRPEPAAAPITEGQRQELEHLAVRLQINREQLEERLGKGLDTLKRVEGKEWIKRLRAMAEEVAPNLKVKYGQWPDTQEDREALFLREHQEAAMPLTFKLFNGEVFTGPVVDFTPYTITLKVGGTDMVLRKLAIAYYRQADDGTQTGTPGTVTPEENGSPSPRKAGKKQQTETEIESDHIGVPDKPEQDNMDEDRGA
ncbi:MAG TPA: helix-turn-helix domain-containing protein [Chloroflexia bacterium]|nr:helix-turn-helix domain-containing protein [Chloroflexia bacterium]